MPRAKAVSDEVKPKRQTASRAPRRVPAKAAAPVKRKAPTDIPISKGTHSIKSLAITLGVFLVITAGSAFVGMADSGQINVSSVIQERGDMLREEGREEEAKQLTIPKNDGRKPNGGLRLPAGGSTSPPPPPPPETLGAQDSTSTSSESAIAEDTVDGDPQSATTTAVEESVSAEIPSQTSTATTTETPAAL